MAPVGGAHMRWQAITLCALLLLAASAAEAQRITQILDPNGDAAGNPFLGPYAIDVDDAGNAYVAGGGSNNAFRIEPDGTISEIIAEGAAIVLFSPRGIATSPSTQPGTSTSPGFSATTPSRSIPTGRLPRSSIQTATEWETDSTGRWE